MTTTTTEPAPDRPSAPDRATAEDPHAEAPALTQGAAILTRRERKIVQLVCYGHKLKDIAKRLGISIKTAESHKGNAYRKLGIHNVADLTRWAIQNRLCKLAG